MRRWAISGSTRHCKGVATDRWRFRSEAFGLLFNKEKETKAPIGIRRLRLWRGM